MRERLLALVFVASTARGASAAGSCVASLRDVHTGSGAKSFTSHYVTSAAYGYGEFRAGTFGGQSLWKQQNGTWCRVETGTTVLDRDGLLGAGVPAAVAATLLAKMRAAGELAPPNVEPRHR